MSTSVHKINGWPSYEIPNAELFTLDAQSFDIFRIGIAFAAVGSSCLGVLLVQLVLTGFGQNKLGDALSAIPV